MAIIVNDRDVLLQSTVPRVQQVGLPPNVSIDPSNVPGLQAAFDATKEVSLSATSQLFVVPKVGAIQPASIDITAMLKTITGTPTFTLIDGNVSFTNSGNKITVLASNMNSPTATIEVAVLFNSVTYRDRITIGKIAEGSDAVVGLLSNESCTVAASDLGNVSGAALATAGGTFNIFDGVINKTGQATVAYSVFSETGCDLSINSAGVYTVNSISSNTGSAVLRAVYTRPGSTSVTIDKVYSVSKAIAGIIGANAKLLYVSATSQIFQIPKNGSVTPAAITLTATAQNLDQAAAYTWTTTPVMTLGGSSNVRTLNYTDMTADTVKIDVTRDGLTDTITLVKVREGNDALVGYLTNESVVVPADSGGVVAGSSFTTAGGTFEVYQGLTHLTGIGIAYSVVSEQGVDVSINATTGAYSVVSMSSDSGAATFRASLTIAGITINLDKVYSIAKSRAGQTGPGGAGSRGTVNIAAAIAGSTWTDAAANAALTSAGYGSPQSRDIVTLYNTSTNFSQSKFYTGSAWATLDAYINGNLLVSRTIASAAIQTGAIGAEHISVGTGGKNILQNSMPAKNSVYGWFNNNNNTGQSFVSAPFQLPGYGPTGINAVCTHMTNAPASGTVFEIANDNFGKKYPVVANQRYEVSAYISNHRTTNAYIIIFWQRADGSPSQIVSEVYSPATNFAASQYGSRLGDWPRAAAFIVAPSDAATMVFGIRATCNGTADPFIMASMCYFGEASPNQTTFSPWTDGGTSTIGPGGIVTPNLSAISADIGKVTAGWLYGPVATGGYGYSDHTSYAFPSNGGNGYHLSASGLLLGNPVNGAYFQITDAGNIYAPSFSLVNGNLTMRGSLSNGSMTGFGWPTDGGNGAHIGPAGLLVGNATVAGRPYLAFDIAQSTFDVWTPYMSFSNAGAYFAGTLRAGCVDTDQIVDRSISAPIYSGNRFG